MSGNACPQCGREHPWCDAEWSAYDPDADRPGPVDGDAEGPPYRVGELLPDILDFLARGSRGPDWAGARESPGRSLRGLIPGPRRRY
ncbi:hypothetical protein [Embleya scabrispora]|uniref:hypothetical protein n=1 Tax=Embleya scabrispora TaxID=159449 RepID=UPI0003683203|nr:hypothetical protein [Embleya scabrispora]MYS81358.1 hypothetical protein [Streptomyces sp. SID5474]